VAVIRSGRRLLAILGVLVAPPLAGQTTVGALTQRDGDVPIRVVGYGLVVGLDGTGDRSFGSLAGSVQTVRSVTNLLRRFNIEIPPERLRLRNVAAVLVTAEISPYLRPGARFEVQVASVGDATSLRGGVLWMTPLLAAPNAPPVATAQGALPVVALDDRQRFSGRGAASARIADGGLLEAALPPLPMSATPRLILRTPDLQAAARIADVINAAVGPATARVEDPGAIVLSPPGSATDNMAGFLAGLDTLPVTVTPPSRIIIDGRSGTVVAGGNMTVGRAVVSLNGLTLRIGTAPADGAPDVPGLLTLAAGTTVQDIAAGLRAVGAPARDVVAVFDGLRAAGAVTAEVVIR
jgi:flagellar P-ring protein FlgI